MKDKAIKFRIAIVATGDDEATDVGCCATLDSHLSWMHEGGNLVASYTWGENQAMLQNAFNIWLVTLNMWTVDKG